MTNSRIIHAAISAKDKTTFERDGYHLVRPLFSEEEAAHWRNQINAVFDFPAEPDAAAKIAGATHTLADGVTTTENFWPVIFNERLLATVRALIGNEIRYTQHSDLQVAIYLSDHNESNSSLVVLPGSHRRETRRARTEYVIWNKLRGFLRRRGRNNLLSHHFLTTPRHVLRTQPGDCVIFDQRLMHAGGVIHGPEPKYAIYLSFGIDNQHSRNHRAFFLDRPTYSPNLPVALRARLSENGLLLEDASETIQP